MANLTKAQIDELKEKGLITQVIPSDDLASKTVDGLKIEKYVTVTDPSVDIEAAVTHTIPVEGVEIDEGLIEPVDEGNVLQIHYSIIPGDATNQNVTMKSSDINVFNVQYNAKDGAWSVYGISGGFATLTVTTEDGGYTDTAVIEVVGRD